MATSDILDRLFDVIRARRSAPPDQSYVARLLADGLPAVAAKVTEESAELVQAAQAADPAHTAHEAADLLFHLWVLLAAAEVEPSAVYAELERRFGTSGLAEKAARGQVASATVKSEGRE